jgi:hypothetical protein
MPALNLESLDDELIFDVCPSLAGGQVSNPVVRAPLLKQTEAILLENFDIARNATRRGTVRLGANPIATPANLGTIIQGMIYYETPANSYLVSAWGAHVYKYIAPNWSLLSVTGYIANDTTSPVAMAVGIDRLYFADGALHIFSWDGTNTVDLGGATNDKPPNAPSILVWHTSRLVAAGMPDQPDAIYFSNFLDGAVWNRLTQSLRVGGDGDPIIALIPWMDFNLVVLKRHSIWVVNCDPSLSTDPALLVSLFPIRQISKNIGCGSQRSVVQFGNDVFFVDDKGNVRSIQRVLGSDTQQQATPALSYPVQDIMNRINLNVLNKVCATSWNDLYIVALPLDSSLIPNYCAVFNKLTGTWSGRWTGWTPMCFSRRVATGTNRMVFGTSDGRVLEWLDYVPDQNETDATYQDDGVEIATTILTRAFTLNEPVSPKTGFNVEFEFNKSIAEVTIETIVDDYSSPTALESPVATMSGILSLPLTLPFTLPRSGVIRAAFDIMRLGQWRELQFRLSAIKQKLALRSVTVSGFIDTMLVQTQEP